MSGAASTVTPNVLSSTSKTSGTTNTGSSTKTSEATDAERVAANKARQSMLGNVVDVIV